MANLFQHAWEEISRGFADIRSKLLTGWFGRDPDTPRAGDLGWTLGSEEPSRAPDAPGSFMEQFYGSARDLSEPEPPDREPDHGIDR